MIWHAIMVLALLWALVSLNTIAASLYRVALAFDAWRRQLTDERDDS